jgi:deoxyadenosine/deoxycytidine kinase
VDTVFKVADDIGEGNEMNPYHLVYDLTESSPLAKLGNLSKEEWEVYKKMFSTSETKNATRNRIVLWINSVIAFGHNVLRFFARHKRDYEISTTDDSEGRYFRELWANTSGSTNTQVDNKHSSNCFDRYDRVRAR